MDYLSAFTVGYGQKEHHSFPYYVALAALYAEGRPVRLALMQCAAHYLLYATTRGKPADPVARFHLGNGARIEQINWAGDPSAKGHKQSYGLMVNYLYDLKRLDKHRSLLAQGKAAASKEVESLCPR